MERNCNAEASRTDRLLRQKREELDRAQLDALAAVAKAVRIQKEVRFLEKRSDAELDKLMEEIEKENENSEERGDNGTASGSGGKETQENS
jgi:hypothetical protein